jgi:hypothetical protein
LEEVYPGSHPQILHLVLAEQYKVRYIGME